MNQIRTSGRSATGVTTWDPSAVFVIKSLLYPLTATLSLGLSLLVCREPFQHSYFLLAVLAFLATADFLEVTPLQRDLTRAALPLTLVQIAVQWLIIVGFIWTLIVLSGLRDHFHPDVVLSWAAITPVVLWTSGLAAHRILTRHTDGLKARRKAVIVGCDTVGRLLERRLRDDPALGIGVLGFFDDFNGRNGNGGAPGECDLLGEPAHLAEFIVREGVQLVYVTWPMTRESRILELLESLRDSTVSIYFVPDVSVVNLIQGRVDLIGGIPVVAVCESPFYGIRGLVKRLCDVVLAGAIVVTLAPVLLAVAIGVRLSSPGPIVFRQRRYGLDGKEIIVYKFRSMTVTEDGEKSYTQVTRNDSRVTRFGAFIRRTSLDELPQLFNVLEGSMSLVGPRPHAIAVNEQYRRLISGYMVRHKVKPGITGWAQVNGWRGGDDLESMRHRVEFDLEYLRNWSLRLDLAILMKTIALVWADRRAF